MFQGRAFDKHSLWILAIATSSHSVRQDSVLGQFTQAGPMAGIVGVALTLTVSPVILRAKHLNWAWFAY